jgi:hypothetical protein
LQMWAGSTPLLTLSAGWRDKSQLPSLLHTDNSP